MLNAHKHINSTIWPMKPYKRPYGGTPGPPVMYEKPSDPEDDGAGYGYTNAEAIAENDIYFYHSDHLGSTSYITDKDGNATQKEVQKRKKQQQTFLKRHKAAQLFLVL